MHHRYVLLLIGKWSGIRYGIAERNFIKKAEKVLLILRRANTIFPGMQDILKSIRKIIDKKNESTQSIITHLILFVLKFYGL